MGDRPALWNIKTKQRGKLLRSRAGDSIAPGAELRELLSVFVKRQIAMHHGGHADRTDSRQLDAESGLDIGLEIGKTGLKARVDSIHRIGPHAVYELVFPFIVAGGNGNMLVIYEHRLDTCRAQLDAQCGL